MGEHGEGHKTATMHLGEDSIILSQPAQGKGLERVCGLLSRSLHEDLRLDAIVLPIIR